jgi:peptide-methionine (R)-S-oxide reductase
MKRNLTALLILISLGSCAQGSKESEKAIHYKVQKTEEEWKSQLSPQEYEVLREEGTEMAFTGKYVDWKKRPGKDLLNSW